MNESQLIKELIERNKSKKYQIFQSKNKTIIFFVNTALLLSGGINLYIIPETNIEEDNIKELADIAFAIKITAYLKLSSRNKEIEEQVIEDNLYLYDIYETDVGEIINTGAIKEEEIIYIPFDNEAINDYANLLINEEAEKMTVIFVNKNSHELRVFTTPYRIVMFKDLKELEEFIKNPEFDISNVLNEITTR